MMELNNLVGNSIAHDGLIAEQKLNCSSFFSQTGIPAAAGEDPTISSLCGVRGLCVISGSPP